jgi:hypothetical protein
MLLVATLAAGCPMDDDEDDGGAGDDDMVASTDEGSSGMPPDEDTAASSTGEELPARIEGTIGRSATAELAPDGDGIGTVYIAAFSHCATDAPLVGFVALPNADLSQPDVTLPFVIEELFGPAVHLAAFMDDDGNADPMAPLPDPGDPVLAEDVGDGLLTCVEVALVPGETASPELWLNLTEQPPS